MNLRRHPIFSTWHWMWLAGVLLLLAGCNPQPAFTVTPTPVVAGVEASFDASSTVIANTHKGNAAVSYTWAFGDGRTGSGRVVKHTYAQPGTYTVTLTVVDKAGRSGTYKAPVVVAPPAAASTLFVQVQGADGALISAANLSIGSASSQSDGLGVARFLGIPAGADRVLRVTKAGYIGQSIRTTLVAGNSQSLLVTLRPLNDPIAVPRIQDAQAIQSPNLGASVTLPDGSVFTKSATLNAEVTTIINLPSEGSIRWTATTTGGQIGTAISGTSGNVVIPLSAPRTSNTVRCTLTDGTPVDCNVDLSAPLAGGGTGGLSRFVPAGGALVRSGLDTAGPLQWRASSRLALNARGDVVRYEGSASSGLSGEVTIVLNTEVAASGRRVFFICAAQADGLGAPQPLTACTINVRVFDRTERIVGEFTLNGAPGARQSLVLPLVPGGFLNVTASGNTAAGPVFGFDSFNFDELSADQEITLQTSANVPT